MNQCCSAKYWLLSFFDIAAMANKLQKRSRPPLKKKNAMTKKFYKVTYLFFHDLHMTQALTLFSFLFGVNIKKYRRFW